jgi:outer membrane protein assembly factor BamB
VGGQGEGGVPLRFKGSLQHRLSAVRVGDRRRWVLTSIAADRRAELAAAAYEQLATDSSAKIREEALLARDEDRVVQLFLAESCDDAPADMLLEVWQWWTGSLSRPDRPHGHPNFPRHGLLRYSGHHQALPPLLHQRLGRIVPISEHRGEFTHGTPTPGRPTADRAAPLSDHHGRKQLLMNPLGTGDPLRLGPYRLLGVLGEGGMGKVYIGQDGDGRAAAVKVLRPELAHNHNLAQRFVREAQMAQAVTSTGVAQVLGAQTEGGRPWIACEFLTGPTLEQAVRSFGPFDEQGVRVLAATIAQTLTDVHAAGLIHRDLKPDNIVLTSAGPRIIDFGIARPEHGLTLTTTGQIPVTPGYGAPEQVMGRRVGPPADVFSLGAVLAYATSGQRAYDGGHVAAVQYEVVHGEPRLDSVPEQLRTLIAPCLAKDPALRPTPSQITTAFAPTPGAEPTWHQGPLADDIKQREHSVHQLTTVVSGSGAGGRGISRRRLLTTLAAGGTVLAAGGGSAAWWLNGREQPQDFTLPRAAKTPKAELIASDRTPGKAPAPLWGPVPVLDKQAPHPLPVRDVIVFGPKGGGIAALGVVDGKRRWTAPEINPAGGFVSLSDALIAAVDRDGKLVTMVASTGERRWSVAAGVKAVITSDDSAVYVSTRDGRLRGISRSDGRVLWTAKASLTVAAGRRPAGAAARGCLVVAARAEADDVANGNVVAFDATNGAELWKLPSHGTADGASVSPVIAGNTVYINGKSLTARGLTDGEERWGTSNLTQGQTQPSGPPLVVGDTVFASAGTRVIAYETGGGDEAWQSPEHYFMHSPVAVQGNGVYVISGGEKVSGVTLWAITRDSRKKAWTYSLTEDGGGFGVVANGNRIFIRNGTNLLALPAFA